MPQPTPEQSKAYYQKNKGRIKESRNYRNAGYKFRFGITVEEYNTMLDKQNHVCVICEEPSGAGTRESKRLALDHNHTTGKLRELLCHHCNVAIGSFKEDPVLLRKAAAYLEKHA